LYQEELRDQVSQGDVFDEIPVPYVRISLDTFEAEDTEVRLVRAIMLTHDCEFDKPRNTHAYVAEVRPLNGIDPGSQGNVRQYRTINAFFLEARDGTMEESYVDFRCMFRVPEQVLKVRTDEGRRLVSLTDDGRLALQRQIALFFGHSREQLQAA